MKILGIESSCDETAAAVVEITDTHGPRLLSNVVASSMDIHVQYGGVVPEIAARSHIESIMPVIEQALLDAYAGTSIKPSMDELWEDIDGIAVTYGAGLGGCLLVGVTTARTLAISRSKPLYAINHVEGHVYANFITSGSPAITASLKFPANEPKFPLLALIVSGGHSQLVLFRDHFDYTLLGQTLDDAIGEAFDKVAKVLGLPYPGGPSIANMAKRGDPHAFEFPKAKLKDPYNYSFSGPKTAVLRTVQQLCGKSHDFPSFKLAELLSEAQKADVAASFQRVAIETVVDKTVRAFEEFSPASVVIGGGVAASPELRRQLSDRLPIDIKYADPKLCTDNGAMIATLGCYKMKHDQPTADPYTLDINPNLSM
ncbi:MAG: tRNA (adenosine(37)-N6)-threonylcarbamoyltransferase complex transferase subunit TsaD [Candidatus Saccharibacteria bacterium]|nr:tRNA (adenosine(37)-N6)-threonylcarbamoyltransferase complex transferase subunit TsaD [Candidatus Saccharibacteria bacterium]